MIRLQRVGRKHEPVFRLVLTDSKNGPKSGKFLEILGSYDARRGEKAEFNVERAKYWMKNGAKLSDTAHNLFVEKKIIEGKKINKLPKKSVAVSASVAEEIKISNTNVEKETPAETPIETPIKTSVENQEPEVAEKTSV